MPPDVGEHYVASLREYETARSARLEAMADADRSRGAEAANAESQRRAVELSQTCGSVGEFLSRIGQHEAARLFLTHACSATNPRPSLPPC